MVRIAVWVVLIVTLEISRPSTKTVLHLGVCAVSVIYLWDRRTVFKGRRRAKPGDVWGMIRMLRGFDNPGWQSPVISTWTTRVNDIVMKATTLRKQSSRFSNECNKW